MQEVEYDRVYYENYNGGAYGRNQQWLSFFDNISKNIIDGLNPKTVLDVGCAYGLLVETLRDRGVQAFGIDVSSYAIKQSRPDLTGFLAVSSILDAIPERYDLIVSIEVIEHIEEKHCDTAVANMCRASDHILLATTPDDFDDPTHFNVNPPKYWIEKFSQHGFEPDVSFDAGFLTPYAILFRKNKRITKTEIHSLFGQKKLQDLYFARLSHERNVQAVAIMEKEKKISLLESDLGKSHLHINNIQDNLKIETTARRYFEDQVQRIHSSFLWKITLPYRLLTRLIRVLTPLFPKVIFETTGQKVQEFETEELLGWGLILATLENDSNAVLKLKAKSDFEAVRVLALPIIESGRKRGWIFRNKGESNRYSIEISYGQPQKIEFIKISTVSALVKMIKYRWKIGRGFRAGLNLIFRCSGHLLKLHPRKIFDEIWPKVADPQEDYASWLDNFDALASNKEILSWLSTFSYQPLISIILPTYNSDLFFLSEAIKSVESQSYNNWQLCIADDGSSDEKLLRFLKKLNADERIDINFIQENRHISIASNTAIELAKGEYITFLDHDDLLHPHALAVIVGQLNRDKNIDLIYSDEDKIDEVGNRSEPNFKPDWNPDLLLSQNYICHLAVYRKSIVEEIGGLREGFEGAQDYDLLLRVTEKTNKIFHIPLILYHWRAVPGSTALNAEEKNYAYNKASQAIRDCIQRRGLDAEVLPSSLGVYHRIKYNVGPLQPVVSIIIPTRDHVELLETCIDGILNRTNYTNWEILIVDNDSQQKRTHEYFRRIQSEKIRILKFSGKFNYSAINNYGARQARGEVLLLLNNDIEIIEPSWLNELVSHAMREEIGAVGARLYYSDDSVQHDGIVVGIGGVAGYANPRLGRFEVGTFGGSRLIRNFSAITAAALAVRKELFEQINGFDEKNLEVAFNDVDLCLRLMEAGYRNLYTPYCELYHHESLSRGLDVGSEKEARFKREAEYMKKRWLDVISDDPHYNPNLSLQHGFALDVNRGKSWPWDRSKKSREECS